MMETQNYTNVAKALHWLIALMIIVQIPAGFFMHSLDFSQTKFTLYQLHKSFGLVVLSLSLFRLFWRLTHKVPPLPTGTPAWQAFGARFTHVAFYLLIIGIPLTGWLMVSASPTNIPTKLFFLLPVPHWPVPSGETAAAFWAGTHEWLAKATVGLLVLHIGAALQHHFRERDDVLVRMLPLVGPLRRMGDAKPPSTDHQGTKS